MLDKEDYKEIANIMKVIVESDVSPRFNLLEEGIQTINEKLDSLAPKSRVEELEDEVKLLKSVIKLHSEEIAKLKQA